MIITDPDLLRDGMEISVCYLSSPPSIQLNQMCYLTTDGVTIKTVYSKLKELWKDDATYIKYPFPMEPIHDEQFEVKNGWDWANDSTRYLLRTGGWALKDTGGTTQEEWASIISLGTVGGSDQIYFQQSGGGSAANFQLTGPINQAIKVWGDVTHGDFNYRGYLKVFCREWQKTYALSQLSDIGVSTMTYQAYRFPVANATDVKVTHTENAVDTTTPYDGMCIVWYATAQPRSIGGTNYDFHVIVDGNSGTAEQIYEFVQRQLRKDSDIDSGSGSQIGKVTPAISRFVGDTLYTIKASEGGTFIDDYQSADINRLIFLDDTNTERTFPYSAVITINFGDNLKNDTNAKYWIYFTDVPNGNYGDSDAIIVQDASSSDMTGNVSGQNSIQKTFAYDTNTQGGRTAVTDAPITAVAIGLSTSQFVKATASIVRSTANSVSLVSALERNYANPS